MVEILQDIEGDQQLPAGGFIYEPRSLWDIQSAEIGENASTQQAQRIRFNREHLYNGMPYPIQINRIALLAVNYAYQRVPAAPADFDFQAMSALQGARLTVSAPYRQHYGRTPFFANTIAPQPTGMPETRQGFASSLWGQSVLNFDKALMLPSKGTIAFQTSNRSPIEGIAGPGGAPVGIATLFQESGGLFSGSSRFFGSLNRQMQSAGGEDAPQLEQGWPFPFDVFHEGGGASGITNWWSPDGLFNAREWDRQESTRAGSSKLTSLRVMVNQIAYDDRLQEVGQQAIGTKVAPLSTRIGCRCKTTSGGTDMDWWRPGIPLALALDTITPATVYQLPQPITLAPKDTLDVELLIPPSTGAAPQGGNLFFNIGIALNGWAAIKG